MFKYELNQKVWTIENNNPKCGTVVNRCCNESTDSNDDYIIYKVRFNKDGSIINSDLIREEYLSGSGEELIQKIKDKCIEEMAKQC